MLLFSLSVVTLVTKDNIFSLDFSVNRKNKGLNRTIIRARILCELYQKVLIFIARELCENSVRIST